MAITVGSLASLDDIAGRARAHFEEKNRAREGALSRSREVIRSSANTIRAVHRHDFDLAARLLAEARAALETATASVAGFPDVQYAGFVHDAQKEFAEASTVLTVLRGEPLPGPEEVGVDWPAYLNGLGEAIGELRRFLVDGLRRNELSAGDALLQAMDDIYDVLVTIDYPDGMTGGLRRTTDVARGILEKTRGDLTVAVRQDRLERQLRTVEDRAFEADHAPSS
jgi:translin